MSRITFLDNADEGKNNWWRYLVTIILTWGVPSVLEIIALIYLLSLNRSDINSFLSQPLILLAIIGLTELGYLLFLYIGIRYIHKRKFISLVNTDSKFSWRRVLKGGGVWFGLLALVLVISLILNPKSINVTFNSTTFPLLLILSLMVFPIQASFEELFFRGYLMQGIGFLTKKAWKRFGLVSFLPVVPLIATSLIFAIPHYFNGTNTLSGVDILLQALILGLTLGIITLGENRLETAMGVHIANNLFVALIVNSSNGGFGNIPSLLTDTSPPNLIDVPIFVLYALLLLIIIFWGKKERIYRIFS